jgi:Asp-tRNA(Asn)/Glu-tRNA(Gln) amidotransferase A subunit family amidase
MNRITNTLLRCLAVLLIASGTAGVRAGGARAVQASATSSASSRFHVEEATIADVHRAIQRGDTTCRAVVESYVERARAYNSACTQLVTSDGKPILPTTGPLRAGAPVSFPTSTMSVASVLPTLEAYSGLPLDLGRMEATQSDPTVRQQYGMVAGIDNAGQISALSTLNLRGERSVTCKADCDRAPAAGPLPASCPASCDAFRRQPDALERASELDARYGRRPDLKVMPMYCIALSFKDVYDTTDMRTTGGADVNYATDAPPKDATVVSELRAKGAIIYAKANLDEYNAGAGDPGGAARPTARGYGAGARSTWGGTACNPYDTTRETGGSSSGSAAGVAANLVQCSICEETGGSCRQPAWRNDIVAFVTTKGLMPFGGAIGADPYLDRGGIQCRTVVDAAAVLDALKDPQRGYFDPRDIYTALPKGFISSQPYASYAAPSTGANAKKPLAGMRIGIVREYMVKHAANDRAMSDIVNGEITAVLRDRLGAAIIESADPLYPDDPSIPNLTYTFQQALAEILPLHFPEYMQRASAVAGYDVAKRDYMVKASEGLAPWPASVNMRSVNSPGSAANFGYDLAHYLLRRGDERVRDWASLNANAKYYSAGRVAAMKNWENAIDLVSAGMTQNVKMREVLRLVVMKVMRQNNLDVLVNPTTTIPPAKIGFASQPQVNSRPTGRFSTSANIGVPEITVPAGFNSVVYEPRFALNASKDAYVAVANEDTPSTLLHPMPVGMSFWGGPGEEGVVIRAAAAYEAATHRRREPQAFGAIGARRTTQ